MAQLVARVSEGMMTAIDGLVADGEVASRSDAVRIGLEALLDKIRRERVGQAIVDGYTHHPQVAADVGWADEASAAMISEEPW